MSVHGVLKLSLHLCSIPHTLNWQHLAINIGILVGSNLHRHSLPVEVWAVTGHAWLQVGASILTRVLQRLPQAKQAPGCDILVGLDAPDDAAVIRPPPAGHVLVQTVDFFKQFVSDPYVFGAIAANHALGVSTVTCLHNLASRHEGLVAIIVLGQVEHHCTEAGQEQGSHVIFVSTCCCNAMYIGAGMGSTGSCWYRSRLLLGVLTIQS